MAATFEHMPQFIELRAENMRFAKIAKQIKQQDHFNCILFLNLYIDNEKALRHLEKAFCQPSEGY